MPRQIDFYFDYISPNAYLAWTQLQPLAEKHQLEIRLIPVLFTGLLRAFGQMGPAEQPAKQAWMTKNIVRKAVLLDVPLNPPKHHPFNPLLALRISSLEMNEITRWQVIDAFMRAIWVEQQHLSEPEVVAAILDQLALDGDALVQQACQASARLQEQTQQAIECGVFGIPSVIYDEELFFGYDDFPYLEMSLEDQDPANAEMAQSWLNARWTASSMRKEVKTGSSQS